MRILAQRQKEQNNVNAAAPARRERRESTKNKREKESKKGQGLGETKWKGCVKVRGLLRDTYEDRAKGTKMRPPKTRQEVCTVLGVRTAMWR
jgi:hypothetical protein